jgi:hypothetical protein
MWISISQVEGLERLLGGFFWTELKFDDAGLGGVNKVSSGFLVAARADRLSGER